jgi:large subunit ribosomal protein L21
MIGRPHARPGLIAASMGFFPPTGYSSAFVPLTFVRWNACSPALRGIQSKGSAVSCFSTQAGFAGRQNLKQKNALGNGLAFRASVTAYEGSTMYAVIRTGGKQYRVAPGDVLKVEKLTSEDGSVEFSDVLAVSGEAGNFESALEGAKVTGSIVGHGRGEKILVFKFKRKKQYKRMQGHRQSFTEIKIGEISVNGKRFTA